jgi:hypothetical protein
LNLAYTNIGEMVTNGWEFDESAQEYFKEVDGEEQVLKQRPEEYGPLGAIAIAIAIPDMRAMMSLNLASNKLGVEGAKIIAACLPKCT